MPESPPKKSRTSGDGLQDHKVVDNDAWVEARKELLAKEKELTKLSDEVARLRRELPWEKMEEDYEFEGTDGQKKKLSELFGGNSQLIVVHFMFDSEWEEGCKSCSFWADGYDGFLCHIEQRDCSFVVVSKAPAAKLEKFQKRMGWKFRWFSAYDSNFNESYHASFRKEDLDSGDIIHNYKKTRAFMRELPATSVFYKDPESGEIYHTYSTYSRGLDHLNGAYQYLDLLPKGRSEEGLHYTMSWLKHHDKY